MLRKKNSYIFLSLNFFFCIRTRKIELENEKISGKINPKKNIWISCGADRERKTWMRASVWFEFTVWLTHAWWLKFEFVYNLWFATSCCWTVLIISKCNWFKWSRLSFSEGQHQLWRKTRMKTKMVFNLWLISNGGKSILKKNRPNYI